jgi:(S)-ureidoglycine aminohydrolase
MPELFGHTRARVSARHALITPGNHVGSSIPGIFGASAVVLINPAMGARFAQTLVTFQTGGGARFAEEGLETFGYVLVGEVAISLDGRRRRGRPGAYFLAPAGQVAELSAVKAGAQVMLFQKAYAALPGVAAPRAILGDAADVAGVPFLGDPAANLQVLLPDGPAFDFAVNVFAYQPGGHLPFVEVHVMEHGLVMLDGEGVYRLEDDWYPVRRGDVIWMAPYCAQWFVAMGKRPARYLYYKDVNRAAL